MHRSRAPSPRLALAGFFLVLGVAAVQGRYQDDKKKPVGPAPPPAAAKEFVKYKVTVAATEAGDSITLRPNVRQKVYVKVSNPSAKAEALTVLLKAGGNVEATAKVEAKEGVTEVKWAPAPAKKDAVDGPFEIVLADKDGKPLPPKVEGGKVVSRIDPAPLLTRSPFEYLRIADGERPGAKKLSVKVSAADGKFAGPPARIVLNIPPDRIKGERKGTFSGYVAKGATTELVAEPIEPTASNKLVDSYSLDVDGIKRGLLFSVTTAADGRSKVEPNDRGRAGLLLPRITRPTDKMAVDVLSSGNIGPDDRIVVSLLATPAGAAEEKYVPVATFVGPRQVKLLHGVSLDGYLYLEPVAAEHRMTLDLSGIFGATKVRVGIYAPDQFDAEGNLKPGATVRNDTDETTQEVLVSDAPPKVDLKALRKVGPKGDYEPTADALRGQRVTLRATVSSAAAVTAVKFVVGPLPPDGKLPPDALSGQPEGGGAAAWNVEYAVPADAKAPLEVTAVAVNELGLEGRAGLKLNVLDAVPEAATVSGKVFESDVPLDNLPVILVDPSGTEVAAVRSGGGGKFAMPNIPPGKYFLFARREQTGAKGMMEITVRKPTRQDLGAVDPTDIELILAVPPEVKPKDKEKKDEKPKKAKISGSVVEDERVQVGLKVQLIDATGKVVKTATTDEYGSFLFKDLDKGKYAVAVAKNASRTKARAEVELDAGQTKSVGEMKLFR